MIVRSISPFSHQFTYPKWYIIIWADNIDCIVKSSPINQSINHSLVYGINIDVCFVLTYMMDKSCRKYAFVFLKTNKGYQRRRASLILPNLPGYLCSKCYHHLGKQPKELQVSLDIISYQYLYDSKIGLGKIHQSLSALPGQTLPNVQIDIITGHVDMGYF